MLILFIIYLCVQKPEVVRGNRKYRIRVLVCAPSNSALDEIVLRLMTTGMCFTFIQDIVSLLKVSVGLMVSALSGLRDENAQKHTPNIVRIGVKAHHSIKSVSIDYLVCI